MLATYYISIITVLTSLVSGQMDPKQPVGESAAGSCEPSLSLFF